MESENQDTTDTTSGDFAENSVLEVIVPSASSVELEEIISTWDGSSNEDADSILPFVPQRTFLFFDELVSVYIVLRTPQTNEKTLMAYLSRLDVTLEAYAISTVASREPADTRNDQAATNKELLFSQTMKDKVEPTVIAIQASVEDEDDVQSHYVYIAWRMDVSLGHPKTRLQKPAVFFKPSASLRPVEQLKKDASEDEYMPSFMPAPINLFQGLETDPVFAGRPPRLSASRVAKIAPVAQIEKETLQTLRSGARRLFMASPALIWRIRYSRWQTSSRDVSIIASLDIEALHISKSPVRLDNVSLTLTHGQVEAFPFKLYDQSKPLICKPGDQTTLIYKLRPDIHTRPTPRYGILAHSLELRMETKVLISEECMPKVSITWKAAVDFTSEPSPGIGKAGYHLERPSSHGGGQRSQLANAGTPNNKPPGPDSLPAPEELRQQQNGQTIPSIEILLSVTGPDRVRAGETFQWSVFILNKADRSRRFALVAIPRRRRGEMKRHESKPSSSSMGKADHEDLAEAVVDENIVYAKQKNARLEAADLVCLSTDVRVGPLAPGACFTTELQFLPLRTGILDIEALRVLDVATNESADVKDLPTIIVLDEEGLGD